MYIVQCKYIVKLKSKSIKLCAKAQFFVRALRLIKKIIP